MYRPTIKSNFWLGAMAVSFLILYWWAEQSRVIQQQPGYQQRLDAANIMAKAIETLQNYRLPSLNLSSAQSNQDALIYALLGEKDSPITTDEGRMDDKITVLNPNYAAVFVDLLLQLDVKRGDTVAVMLTGSMPGANLAAYSAIQSLGLHAVVVSSIGSSWWGANAADFTWLDMEKVLFDKGIFPFRSLAASIGGSDDNGGLRLSQVGRDLIIQAADRNEVTLIRQGSLSENIAGRIGLFSRILPLNHYKAVINIGGGVASTGHQENGNLIPTGLNKILPVKNYPGRGALHAFADEGVPVLHIYDVMDLARSYGLPIGQLPIPKIGVGKVYETEVYNIKITAIAVVLMLSILGFVKYLDRKHYRLREEGVDPDTLI